MKKKILLGITSLTIGGAERVLVDLANALCEEYDITILTIYAKGELEKELNEKINLQALYPFSYQELTKKQKRLLPLSIFLKKRNIYHKKIKKDYNVEIAFLEGPMTRILSVKNKRAKKIAWIHNDISRVFGEKWTAKIKKNLDRKIYAKYQMLVFVSKDNREKFEIVYPDLRDDCLQKIPKRVIYNYIDIERVLKRSEEKVESIQKQSQLTFVTVARLVEQKAIERLVKVHQKLIQDGYFHTMYVIGDGPLREKIEDKIRECKVEETFLLLGQKENPYPYIKQADVFCLLSYFEGLPMVVEEAKILNKSILITDTAAREGVMEYPDATVVENTEEGIYQGIKKKVKQGKKHSKKEYKYTNQKILEKVKKIIGE